MLTDYVLVTKTQNHTETTHFIDTLLHEMGTYIALLKYIRTIRKQYVWVNISTCQIKLFDLVFMTQILYLELSLRNLL